MDKFKEFVKRLKCSLKGHGPSTPLEKKIYTEGYTATRFGSKCEKCGAESWSNDLIYRG